MAASPSTRLPRDEAREAQAITDLATLGQQLRAFRKLQKLRIDDAAALNGTSVDLLSRLENGKGAVRTDKLLAVLEGLGLAMVIIPKDHLWLRQLPQDKVQDLSEAL